MRNFNTKAILLKKHKVNESDLSCLLLSAEFGKIYAWARAARKRSNQNESIDFAAILDLGLYRNGHTRKNNINSIKIIEANFAIRLSFEKFELLSFVLKFLNIVTEDETGSEFFALSELTLREINSSISVDNFIKEKFFFKILDLAGYQFVLDQCSCCGQILNKEIARVYFSPLEGGIICNTCKNDLLQKGFYLDAKTFDFLKNLDKDLPFNKDLSLKLAVIMQKITKNLFNVELS